MFSVNQLDIIWNDALNVIIAERKQYEAIYDSIEEYISEFSIKNTIMIGGTMGVNLLLKKERGIYDFTYDLFTESSFQHANDLTNRIAEKLAKSDLAKRIPPIFILLKTTIPFQKYQIFCD